MLKRDVKLQLTNCVESRDLLVADTINPIFGIPSVICLYGDDGRSNEDKRVFPMFCPCLMCTYEVYAELHDHIRK